MTKSPDAYANTPARPVSAHKKASTGFTLIEAVIALAIWMVLSLSVFFVWRNTAEHTDALLERQSAFENARGSMDVLLMNLQMAHTIRLTVVRWRDGYDIWHYHILHYLELHQINPEGILHRYLFRFRVHLPSSETTFQRLEFGGFRRGTNIYDVNEFASNIAMIQIQPSENEQYMNITVITGCEYPIILEGSVDIRYKNLHITRSWPQS